MVYILNIYNGKQTACHLEGRVECFEILISMFVASLFVMSSFKTLALISRELIDASANFENKVYVLKTQLNALFK